MDTQQKSLKCNGFEVTLFAGGEALNVNNVKVQDLVAAQTLKERRAKAKRRASLDLSSQLTHQHFQLQRRAFQASASLGSLNRQVGVGD